MAIELKFLANVTSFLKGTRDVEGSLDKVADSLDDVAHDSARAADSMGDDFAEAARDVDRSTERMEQSFADLARSAKADMDKAGDAVQRNVGHSGRGPMALQEFKSEAIQNLSETASSFDGSMDSIADGIQGTFGGLAAGLTGPLGLAAGAIAIVGGTFAAQWAASSEEAKESVSAAYDDMLESGLNFLTQQAVQAQVSDLVNSDDYDKLREQAKLLGVSVGEIATAWTTSGEARDAALSGSRKNIRDLNAELQGLIDAQSSGTGKLMAGKSSEAAAIRDQIRDYQKIIDKIEAQADSQSLAEDKVKATRDAVREIEGEWQRSGKAAEEAAKKAADENAKTIDAAKKAAGELGKSKPLKLHVDLDTTAAKREIDNLGNTKVRVIVEGPHGRYAT